MIDIAKSREICDKASKGPWSDSKGLGTRIYAPAKTGGVFTVAEVRGYGYFTGQGIGGLGLSAEEAYAHQTDNAAFIAHAREALPAALDEIERLRAELEQRKPMSCGYCGPCLAYHGNTCALE